MSVGKYLSLEEARKKRLLERFAKQQGTTGDQGRFDDALGAMAFDKPPKNSIAAEDKKRKKKS